MIGQRRDGWPVMTVGEPALSGVPGGRLRTAIFISSDPLAAGVTLLAGALLGVLVVVLVCSLHHTEFGPLRGLLGPSKWL